MRVDLLQRLDEAAEAKEHLQKSLSIAADRPVLAASYAELCERLNIPEDGLLALDSLSVENQNLAHSRFARIKIERRMGLIDQAWSHMEELIEKDKVTNLPASLRINLWHEAFRLLDKQERFPEAYAALVKSKDINRETIPPEFFERKRATKRDSYQKMLRILDQFTPEMLRDWQNRSETENPPAFLLGHPRSGTTLLENILESHSQIISSDERPFFQLSVIDPITASFQPTGSETQAPSEFLTYLSNLPKNKQKEVKKSYFDEIYGALGIKPDQKLI